MESIIKNLKVGDHIKINDWKEIFTVCGVSENFVLANHFETEEYTIIPKDPVEYSYNGIPEGSFICAPDDRLFGYYDGYRFSDPEWVDKYLSDLEKKNIEISVKRRAKIDSLRLCPHLTILS